MSLVKLIDFDVLGDARGQLVALEELKNVPFEIKRVYYMTGMSADISRGYHAHKELEQIAVCVSGSCKMILDNGKLREEVILDSPSKGLYIGNLIWREMHDFSPGCVLLVIASELYDEADYIRDYSQFEDVISHGL